MTASAAQLSTRPSPVTHPSTRAPSAAPGNTRIRAQRWTGRVLSGLAALFLAFDAAMKVLYVPAAVSATTELGYPESALGGIGALELACLVAYLVPRTAPIGAISLTGYLGGAIATHVRVGSPLFSHTLFPIYVATLLWLGLILRDERVKNLLRTER